MSSNYSGRTTPHSDVDHPHRITYSPFNEEEDPQPVPMLPPRPPTPGPITLETRGTQTSPKPCPIHHQYVAIQTIHTPPFARQIQQPSLPLTPTPPRRTSLPPQITRTLRSTQNPHQTRIALATTPPCSNPISKRIHKQETRLTSHVTHHILLFQRKNHQKQGERKEEILHPRTKKDQ